MSSTQLSTVAAATAAPSTARETNFQGEFASPVTTESSVADPALKTAEHNHGQDGSIESIKIPLEDDIMQCARLGEVALLQKMFDSRKYDARYQDGEGLTPLHWAAINNQYATCDFLIKAGANVNARGGESGANPAMWAAQRCHYYIVNLLLQAGTDPLQVDGQGYNLLHLATIDGNGFLLILLLHQEIPVDISDPQGHTSLMWAAYKGFPACVDLLLRWGANVNAADEMGLNALHWALVKGSRPCIQKIIEYGVDRFAQTSDGKTPAIVADEMKSTKIWHQALFECGYDSTGGPRKLPLGLMSMIRNRTIAGRFFFLWPFLQLWLFISAFASMSIYVSVPTVLGMAIVTQRVAVLVARWGLLEYRQIHYTPYMAGIFAATLFWMGVRWVFFILPMTLAYHPFLNGIFAVIYGLTGYFYSLTLIEDPGFVPKIASRDGQKTVIHNLLRQWKFDQDNFCMQCMVRRPLRSKHCRRCGRCVARHDHHCPWINNCVGNDNIRHFLLYVVSMNLGINFLVRLVLVYVEILPSTPTDRLNCVVFSSAPKLCDIFLRDTWTLLLAIWTLINSAWTSMLLFVQLFQISCNQTTYESMKSQWNWRSESPAPPPLPVTVLQNASTAIASGTTNPGSDDPASRTPGSGASDHRRGFLTQFKRLLGLDAVQGVVQLAIFGSLAASSARATSSSSSSSTSGHRRRKKKKSPFSHGIIINCRDFWWDDPGPYFGVRRPNCSMESSYSADNTETMVGTTSGSNSSRGEENEDEHEDINDQVGLLATNHAASATAALAKVRVAAFPGDAALNGQIINYTRLYEMPRTSDYGAVESGRS